MGSMPGLTLVVGDDRVLDRPEVTPDRRPVRRRRRRRDVRQETLVAGVDRDDRRGVTAARHVLEGDQELASRW